LFPGGSRHRMMLRAHPAPGFEEDMFNVLGEQGMDVGALEHRLQSGGGNRRTKIDRLAFTGHQPILLEKSDERAKVVETGSLDWHIDGYGGFVDMDASTDRGDFLNRCSSHA
jgi:hypothetical protein